MNLHFKENQNHQKSKLKVPKHPFTLVKFRGLCKYLDFFYFDDS